MGCRLRRFTRRILSFVALECVHRQWEFYERKGLEISYAQGIFDEDAFLV